MCETIHVWNLRSIIFKCYEVRFRTLLKPAGKVRFSAALRWYIWRLFVCHWSQKPAKFACRQSRKHFTLQDHFLLTFKFPSITPRKSHLHITQYVPFNATFLWSLFLSSLHAFWRPRLYFSAALRKTLEKRFSYFFDRPLWKIALQTLQNLSTLALMLW